MNKKTIGFVLIFISLQAENSAELALIKNRYFFNFVKQAQKNYQAFKNVIEGKSTNMPENMEAVCARLQGIYAAIKPFTNDACSKLVEINTIPLLSRWYGLAFSQTPLESSLPLSMENTQWLTNTTDIMRTQEFSRMSKQSKCAALGLALEYYSAYLYTYDQYNKKMKDSNWLEMQKMKFISWWNKTPDLETKKKHHIEVTCKKILPILTMFQELDCTDIFYKSPR